MTLRVRALSEEEAHRLARMTRSQKLGRGLSAMRRSFSTRSRACAPGIAARMGLCGATVRFWLKRFNERGLFGLAEEEDMRSGRPPTYTAEERSALIAAALSRPAELGLPFASWTLDRLVAYLGEKGIGMKRSRVSEVLQALGLKWRQEETWFGARVDPAFERKWGRSSASTGQGDRILPVGTLKTESVSGRLCDFRAGLRGFRRTRHGGRDCLRPRRGLGGLVPGGNSRSGILPGSRGGLARLPQFLPRLPRIAPRAVELALQLLHFALQAANLALDRVDPVGRCGLRVSYTRSKANGQCNRGTASSNLRKHSIGGGHVPLTPSSTGRFGK
jgi:transposase